MRSRSWEFHAAIHSPAKCSANSFVRGIGNPAPRTLHRLIPECRVEVETLADDIVCLPGLVDQFVHPNHATVQAGDELIYEIVDERVILTKASRGGKADDPFRTFSEWSSEADTKAYGKL
jgi:hypothetical protein